MDIEFVWKHQLIIPKPQGKEEGNDVSSGICPVLSSIEDDAEVETGLKALAVLACVSALMLQWGATS